MSTEYTPEDAEKEWRRMGWSGEPDYPPRDYGSEMYREEEWRQHMARAIQQAHDAREE
jgi:hypothetical protein